MQDRETAPAPGDRVPAVDRAFRILAFLRDHRGATLAQVVDALDLNKSTCLYTLRTLDAVGAVTTSGDPPRYGLGPTLVELGIAADDMLDDLQVTRQHLPDLLDQVEATIVVYRRVTPSTVALVETRERESLVRITVPTGTRIPIQGGSFGRCFLAHDPPEVVDEVLADGLRPFTPRSVTDVDQFRDELDVVRRRGWAVDHEGFALGVSTVAAPVLDATGRARLAVAAVGFTSLMTPDVVRAWAEHLCMATDRIQNALGGPGRRRRTAPREDT